VTKFDLTVLVVQTVLVVVMAHNTAVNWRIGKREKVLAQQLEEIQRAIWPSRFKA
jgi:hypothetical protein